MYLLYTLILILFSPFLLLSSPRKRMASFADRIGWGDIPKLEKPIWIHAVSVGEVLSIKSLITHLRQRRPEAAIVLSTLTSTGQQVAQGGGMDTLIYLPFDLPVCVQRVLDRVNPKIVVIAETEIWPNFLRACSYKKIPVIWINGRISDQSYPRYRWVRFFLKEVLRHYCWMGMQSEEDCRRVVSLGADPKRVFCVGNIKYDITKTPSLPERVRAALTSPLWIAASTMCGEEEIVLHAFRQLVTRHPRLRLLIAPRHPERFDETARLLEKEGFSYVRRSCLPGEAPVVLLDSLGELAAAFECADLVFVGGSLIPHGGHNILEPAFYKKPILFGPHMENFRDMAQRFLHEDAALEVRSGSDLVAAGNLLLSDAARARQLGENAKKIVDAHSGATQRVVSLICRILTEPVL